jgi:hypothetical protein
VPRRRGVGACPSAIFDGFGRPAAWACVFSGGLLFAGVLVDSLSAHSASIHEITAYFSNSVLQARALSLFRGLQLSRCSSSSAASAI